LVYDAEDTGEHWLVNYNRETIQYKFNTIGKMFISSISSIAVSGNLPTTVITLYIEHNKAGGIKFSPSIELKPGYHKAVISFQNEIDREIHSEKDFKVKEISEGEYREVKSLSASLLSYVEEMPFINW
jgi:hypothetical protein